MGVCEFILGEKLKLKKRKKKKKSHSDIFPVFFAVFTFKFLKTNDFIFLKKHVHINLIFFPPNNKNVNSRNNERKHHKMLCTREHTFIRTVQI